MERYELIEGTASKFWEVSVDGAKLIVRYGRIGSQGQTKDKDFASADAATKEKNKLVKEKTGKGYALVGSGAGAIPPQAPVAESPGESAIASAAAAPIAVNLPSDPPPPAPADSRAEVPTEETPSSKTPSDELESFLASALPTRSRPKGPPDAATLAWPELRKNLLPALRDLLQAMMNPENADSAVSDPDDPDEAALAERKAALDWLRTHLSETGPESINAREAEAFAEQLQRGGARTVSCMGEFMSWLVTKATPDVVVEMAAPILEKFKDKGQWQPHPPAWDCPAAMALRAALVKTPDPYYDRVIELSTRLCAEKADWKLAAHFAFIIADDRSATHDLQPLSVLTAATEAGEEISPPFIPLIIDAPASGTSRWRRKQDAFMAGNCTEPFDSAATAVAVGHNSNESALPVLDWLMSGAYHDSDKTRLARLILAVDEPGSLSLLVPLLHEKPIRIALDGAAKDHPARSFRQCLAALAAGRSDPQLKARVKEVITTRPAETLRQWAGSDSKALLYLQRALDAGNATMAEPESWPDVLRDPPWRRKTTAEDDITLKLVPVITPFTYTPDTTQEANGWQRRRARIVESIADLPAVIAQYEAALPKRSWQKIPAPSQPLPQPGESEDRVLKWLDQRLTELYRVRYNAINSSEYENLFSAVEQQPEALSLMLWQSGAAMLECGYSYTWRKCFPGMMARFGEKALPGFLRQIEANPVLVLEYAPAVDAGEIAPHAARALFKLKKARAPAILWLRKYRKTAILRLIPDAVGAKGETRDAAEHALRWIAANTDNGRAEIESLATGCASTEPRLGEALAQVLDRDPLLRYPAKIARLPTWFVPGALSRPELIDGGALPDQAMTALAEMLSFSTSDAVYAGVDIVRQKTTRASLSAFAWDLFSAWMASGAPSKDGWALRAVGWLGDDESARQLTRLIRKWPGESAHARAVTGLDVLVDIGSDIALMNLNGIAEKLKFKGLQEKAREKIAALAEARDLSPEELSDRLAPDLDLDERGGLDLIFGERRFRAGFDEFLKPWVKDTTGQRLKDLPKPNKSDDAEMSAEAVERWKALKKDARSIASLQIARLENMLSTARRTKPDVFWTFFASHPLIRHLAQRLVWGVYADDSPGSVPSMVFRVADDLSMTDAADEPLEIDVSEDATGRIGLVHPLHLPPEGLAAWGTLFGDYEIAQPFPQLSREIFELSEEEKGLCEIARFEGITVEAPRIRGVGAWGWQLGEPQDGGAICWIERKVRMADGTVSTATLNFAAGYISPGSPEYDETPKLGKLSLEGPYGSANRIRRFGELDPVGLSELLRGPHLLVASISK